MPFIGVDNNVTLMKNIVIGGSEDIEEDELFNGIWGLSPIDESSGPLFIDYLKQQN
jgi:hypothetical protein